MACTKQRTTQPPSHSNSETMAAAVAVLDYCSLPEQRQVTVVLLALFPLLLFLLLFATATRGGGGRTCWSGGKGGRWRLHLPPGPPRLPILWQPAPAGRAAARTREPPRPRAPPRTAPARDARDAGGVVGGGGARGR
jgi:hypothetical protein